MAKYLPLLLGCLFAWSSNAATVKNVSHQQLLDPANSHWLIIDVRTPQEYAAGHVTKAVNIPLDQVNRQLDALRPYQNKPIVVYCRSGRRAGMAAKILLKNRFSDVRHLQGDMLQWAKLHLPQSNSATLLSPPQ